MDKLAFYRQILQQVVRYHAQYVPNQGPIRTRPIIDTVHDDYLLIDVGWDNTGRVHSVIFHLRLENGKVWVEWDGTAPGVTQELLAAGIPKEDIVLGFYRPNRRMLTEFAVA